MIAARKISLVFAGAAVASAAITISQWHFRKHIAPAPGSALAVVTLDRDIYTSTRADLADLRVLRDGDEVPYVLESLSASSRNFEQASQILDQSIAPGVGLQLILHLTGTPRHNRVRLETAEHNFRQTVRVESSQDAKQWFIVRSDGAIFDFSQGPRQLSSLVVAYPVSTRPFLRVTIEGWTKVRAITGAYVGTYEERAAAREVLATVAPIVLEDSATKSTLLTADLGVKGLPVDRIRIETSAPLFHRAVDVEASLDGKRWELLTQDSIARTPGEESLTIRIPETRDRYLRARIYNQDNRPLGFGKVRMEGLIHRIKFSAPDSGTYWVYYGNPTAKAPVYDLPFLISKRDHVEETTAIPGPAELNPEYRAPPLPVKPWSERHPAILYVVLGVAVLALGATTIRFALRMQRA